MMGAEEEPKKRFPDYLIKNIQRHLQLSSQPLEKSKNNLGKLDM